MAQKKTKYPSWFSYYSAPSKPREPKMLPEFDEWAETVRSFNYDQTISREELLKEQDWDFIEIEFDRYDEYPTPYLHLKKNVRKPKTAAKIKREQNAYAKAFEKYHDELLLWEHKCKEWKQFKKIWDAEQEESVRKVEMAQLRRLKEKYGEAM